MRTTHIVIVDADDVSRSGMEMVLQKAGTHFQVVATFPDVRLCLEFLRSNLVNILIINDALPGIYDIVKHIEVFHNQFPSLAIIVMSESLELPYIHDLFNRGISGFVLRNDRFALRLVQAVEAVLKGEWYLSPKASRLVYTGQVSPRTYNLSRRDINVARLMQSGYTVQEIATRLGISDQGVYRSRRRLRESLQVQTSEQIIAAAVEKGLL